MNRCLLIVALLLTSCATSRESVQTGTFSGSLDLRWIGPDRFLYVPNEAAPFQFTRASGDVVTPGAMYTDGGSAPSFLRGNPHFTSWGYGPAFVLHDWLFFEASQSDRVGEAVDLDEPGLILAEAMQTLTESGHLPPNRWVRRLYRKVGSGGIARKAIWMRPWYEGLPRPAKAIAQPSLAFDPPLDFVEEKPASLFWKSAEQLRAELESGPRLLMPE